MVAWVIYLASPYSSPDPTIQQQRYEEAEKFAVKLIQAGEPVFSPIAYAAPLAHKFGMGRDFGTWRGFNMALLKVAKKLYVLKIEGWQQSRGVQAEIAFAQENNIPIEFKEPWDD